MTNIPKELKEFYPNGQIDWAKVLKVGAEYSKGLVREVKSPRPEFKVVTLYLNWQYSLPGIHSDEPIATCEPYYFAVPKKFEISDEFRGVFESQEDLCEAFSFLPPGSLFESCYGFWTSIHNPEFYFCPDCQSFVNLCNYAQIEPVFECPQCSGPCYCEDCCPYPADDDE